MGLVPVGLGPFWAGSLWSWVRLGLGPCGAGSVWGWSIWGWVCVGLDQQGHDPTGLSADLGDHSHSIWDGFNPGVLWERGWTMDSLCSWIPELPRTGQGCSSGAAAHHIIPGFTPAIAMSTRTSPAGATSSFGVLMWRSSLARCTKRKMLPDVCGNLGNPSLPPPCQVLEQPMACPALPWPLPQLGIINLAPRAMLVWLSCPCQAATGGLCGRALRHLSAASCLPSHQVTALLLSNKK